jgi:hypothetical protein
LKEFQTNQERIQRTISKKQPNKRTQRGKMKGRLQVYWDERTKDWFITLEEGPAHGATVSEIIGQLHARKATLFISSRESFHAVAAGAVSGWVQQTDVVAIPRVLPLPAVSFGPILLKYTETI